MFSHLLSTRRIFRSPIAVTGGALCVLVLAACTMVSPPSAAPLAPSQPAPQIATAAEAPQPVSINAAQEQKEQQCLEQGGKPGRGGRRGSFICYKPLADAGKPCQDASQCRQGSCLVVRPMQNSQLPRQADATPVTGTCQAMTPLFGCHTLLMQGGQTATRCVD